MTSEQAGMRLFHLFRKAPGQTQMLDMLEMGFWEKSQKKGDFAKAVQFLAKRGWTTQKGSNLTLTKEGVQKATAAP